MIKNAFRCGIQKFWALQENQEILYVLLMILSFVMLFMNKKCKERYFRKPRAKNNRKGNLADRGLTIWKTDEVRKTYLNAGEIQIKWNDIIKATLTLRLRPLLSQIKLAIFYIQNFLWLFILTSCHHKIQDQG